MANNQQRGTIQNQPGHVLPTPVAAEPKQLMDLMTADLMHAQLDRPTPWVVARLEELQAKPVLKLDGVEYYEAEALELLREVSAEWAERVRAAKREAVAMGE